jgi:ribonuclease-3
MSGEARRRRLRALVRRLDLDVDIDALDIAFRHQSAAVERKFPSNERHEFLGDAILAFVAARYLFERFPNASEGELSRRKNALVSGAACAATARRLQFGEVMWLGAGMQNSGGSDNTSILADAFEAFVAALYFAAGMEKTRSFIEREHLAHATDDGAALDVKSELQEFAQATIGATPVYIERAEGPVQDRRFTSQVRVNDEIVGEGIGPSKKSAQQSAAAMALATLRNRAAKAAPADEPAEE